MIWKEELGCQLEDPSDIFVTTVHTTSCFKLWELFV